LLSSSGRGGSFCGRGWNRRSLRGDGDPLMCSSVGVLVCWCEEGRDG
jgi:hypothetical protein